MSEKRVNVRIRRGLELIVPNPPEQVILDGPTVQTVALSGHDYGSLRPSVSVQVGESVVRGQVLFSDRTHPAIKFTAPASGTVQAIERGERRKFISLQIGLDGNEATQFDMPTDSFGRDDVRRWMLASGLWTALRTRPFGRIPAPDASAPNIFVTAMDSNPISADPVVVIERYREQFREGVRCLTLLTDGEVFVCQRGEAPVAGEHIAGAVTAVFSGPHPAGLPGTHMHHLSPVSRKRSAWQIGYQDVIGIGHLAQTGQLWGERIVAVGGPGAEHPALYRTVPGVRLNEFVEPLLKSRGQDELPWRVLSGSPLTGRDQSFLSRFHNQVSALHAPRQEASPRGWARVWRSMLTGTHGNQTTQPIIPYSALDRVLPFDIHPVPLMRALSAGDTEAARRLGCLELIEEDVALLSYLCTSNADYGHLLRDVLLELEEG